MTTNGVRLRPMDDAEFARWLSNCTTSYAKDLALALRIPEGLALDRANQQLHEMLPEGRVSAHNHLLVAEDCVDACRVGSLWLRYNSASGDAFVADLFVEEALRGRGHGRAVMHAAEDFARRLGATGLSLHVFSHNIRAVRLHEDLGYTVTSQNMRKDISVE